MQSSVHNNSFYREPDDKVERNVGKKDTKFSSTPLKVQSNRQDVWFSRKPEYGVERTYANIGYIILDSYQNIENSVSSSFFQAKLNQNQIYLKMS